MSTKDSEALEQQRQRRNRINRMKTGIIVTITVWMLVSLLAIILLTVQVARLSSHVKDWRKRDRQPFRKIFRILKMCRLRIQKAVGRGDTEICLR